MTIPIRYHAPHVAERDIFRAIQAAWDAVGSRFAAYELVMPGAPAFLCQPNLCNAHCCRSFTVNLGEAEVERMARTEHLAPAEFLECEYGEPVALPLAQPYILARRDNHCALLGETLRCTCYAGRPNACRIYPHFLLFFDPQSSTTVHGATGRIQRSVQNLFAGNALTPLVPLLVRHSECPGFTGSPISERTWIELVRSTYTLQYPVS